MLAGGCGSLMWHFELMVFIRFKTHAQSVIERNKAAIIERISEAADHILE